MFLREKKPYVPEDPSGTPHARGSERNRPTVHSVGVGKGRTVRHAQVPMGEVPTGAGIPIFTEQLWDETLRIAMFVSDSVNPFFTKDSPRTG